MQLKIKYFDIQWDTDNEEVELPTEVELVADVGDDELEGITVEEWVAENGADLLSDDYGWCVSAYNFEIINESSK
jgi:hypothetical protein